MRIHTRPPRLIKRVSARRPASIWRAVIRPCSTDFRPYSPKLTLWPRVATPRRRPFITLRYLVRFGCSIAQSYLDHRLFSRFFGIDLGFILIEHFALEDPNFDADRAVGRERLGKTVIDVS